jgi:hypothetical protein
MKKLFVLLMVLAIASTAAFAEVSISGDTEVGWSIIGAAGGVNASGDLEALGVTDQGPTGRVRLVFQAQNEEGTFGARTRLVATNAAAANTTWVWWKPIDQFKVTVGGNDAGYAGMWGLTSAQDTLGAAGDGGNGRTIFSGFGRTGGLFEFYLIDGLDIGINIGSGTFKDSTAPLHIAAKYAVPDLLDVRLGFNGSANAGPAGGYLTGDDFWNADYGVALFEAAVNVSAVPGVTIQVGAKIPVAEIEDTGGKYVVPLLISAAIDVTAIENLGLRVRFAGDLGGKVKLTGGDDIDVPAKIGFSVALQYNAGAFAPGVLFGLTNIGEQPAAFGGGDAVTTWNAVPFVKIPFSGGSADIGFKLSGSSVKDYKIGWAIPLGFTFGF